MAARQAADWPTAPLRSRNLAMEYVLSTEWLVTALTGRHWAEWGPLGRKAEYNHPRQKLR